ncbi:hypothetical protein [Actinoplanes sp. G11-F43]|uniref:NHL domain-containing protein n=1 Tax=Actinoplanes sp. G11-F43 TaxID=3424130 RepID=UPI003D345F02
MVAGTMAIVLSTIAVPRAAGAVDAGFRLAVGSGGGGFSGDGGPASEARLKAPEAAAVAADGTLYIADTGNHRVRAIGPDGRIRTVAGDGEAKNETGPLPEGAKGTEISLGYPGDLTVGADGTVYIADVTAVRVYALASDGTISVRAEPVMAAGTIEPPMEAPSGVAVMPDGTLFVADQKNNRVLVFAPGGAVGEIAAAGFAAPSGLAVDTAGDLWICGANKLHRWRDGELSEVAAAGTVSAVSAGAGGVFTVDAVDRAVHVRDPGGEARAVIGLDPAIFRQDVVLLGAGTTPDGSIHLVDVIGNRVYSHPVPAAGGAGDAAASGTWPAALGGGAVMTIIGVALLLGWRRRRTADRGGGTA